MFSICNNGIFKSIQGEGEMTGRSAVFVRFAGCNKQPRCIFCDEKFDEYSLYNIEMILEEVKNLLPFSMIVLTGGEPTMQEELNELIKEFHKNGYFVSIETNGLLPVSEEIDWITCSPKENYINSEIKAVDELKFVVDDTNINEFYGKINHIKDMVKYKYIYLQPLSNKKKYVSKAMKMISDYPEYRLSVQVHKFIEVK